MCHLGLRLVSDPPPHHYGLSEMNQAGHQLPPLMRPPMRPPMGQMGPPHMIPPPGQMGPPHVMPPPGQMRPPDIPLTIWHNLDGRSANILGGCHLFIGGACIVFQSFSYWLNSYLRYVHHGIWSGLFFMATGMVSMCASSFKTTALVVSMFVMSLISFVLAIICVVLCSFSVHHDYNPGKGTLRESQATAMDVTLLITVLLEAILSVLSSIICCEVLCRCDELLEEYQPEFYMPRQQNKYEQAIPLSPLRRPPALEGGVPYLQYPCAVCGHEQTTNQLQVCEHGLPVVQQVCESIVPYVQFPCAGDQAAQICEHGLPVIQIPQGQEQTAPQQVHGTNPALRVSMTSLVSMELVPATNTH